MGFDPLAEELSEAVNDDIRLLLALSEDFKRLVDLSREVLARHHEVYKAWLALGEGADEDKRPSPGFAPKIVRK